MSVTRAAYDASFAKFVSLVAYRGSRRSENQGVLHDLIHLLVRFVRPNSVPASFGAFVLGGAVWELPPPSHK